ncbi:hypothetical protein GCM10011297_12280 [Bacterioplanes sanyensis]|uniref:hypothetical protein n=1 Tax=Bacterioplanes sanyensis TaxID=1249553 RepID=UPI00167520A7|nr:hypothetical protein [Bacterioplanes sanyensis]GGY40842.1 hypothetical protein GCM10011297_12280 [Bacterioplanes sanyensis]
MIAQLPVHKERARIFSWESGKTKVEPARVPPEMREAIVFKEFLKKMLTALGGIYNMRSHLLGATRQGDIGV